MVLLLGDGGGIGGVGVHGVVRGGLLDIAAASGLVVRDAHDGGDLALWAVFAGISDPE